MRRRALAALPLAAALPLRAAAERRLPHAERLLRVATDVPDVGFDPPRVSDRTSVTVNAHLFESLLTYDPLAWPARLVPQTAAALPEVSDDFKRFVFTLKPGTLFADDPVFKGRPRELVAADYAYSIKRYFDPRIASEHLYLLEGAQISACWTCAAARWRQRPRSTTTRPLKACACWTATGWRSAWARPTRASCSCSRSPA